MGIQIGSTAIYASEPSYIVNVGIFVAGTTGHLGWSEDRAPLRIVKIRQMFSSSSTPISSGIMEKSSIELGGSTSTLPPRDRAVFLDSGFVFAVPTSSSVALTIASVKLCGIESIMTL
jgi:hypothetical protein